MEEELDEEYVGIFSRPTIANEQVIVTALGESAGGSRWPINSLCVSGGWSVGTWNWQTERRSDQTLKSFIDE